ncbi:hypothetical protein B0H13DRAFT_2362603 [Mycena leptocephala]|nr:hypothetical protein B0H13DRAFT_2362603 [Mycena leptocephala]
MSTPPPTNIKPFEVIMDHRGTRDPRYWCLPPFRGDHGQVTTKAHNGFWYHLVWQGRTVGIFDTWSAAHASVTGYPAAGNKGFNTLNECTEAWQKMCPLGVHPHPVEPVLREHAGATVSAVAETPPPKSAGKTPTSATKPVPKPKREEIPAELPMRANLNLRLKSSATPPPSPCKHVAGRGVSQDDLPFVNFAIHGAGIVSSSPSRSQVRYEELQRRGEQPNILVTRDLRRAALFALDDEQEGEESDGEENPSHE